MPTNIRLYNQDASQNTDTFRVTDNNNGGAVIFVVNVQGGSVSDPYDCTPDGQGYGDVSVFNITNNHVDHFAFVRDNDVQNV